MDEEFDNPLDNPMFCGRVAGLDAYLLGEEDDPAIILCDPTGLEPNFSPVNIISEVIETDFQRMMRKAKASEEKEE